MQAKEGSEQAQNSPHYELQGKSLAGYALRSSQTVYLGIPELWCIDNEGRRKVTTPLLVRSNSNAAWQTLSRQQGIYELCYQDEQGNSLFGEKCALLPETFALCFTAGRIELIHNEQAYISCDSPLVASINTTTEGRSIEFNATDTPLADVDLILRWNKSDKLVLTVPFPVCGGQLPDAEGNMLPQVSKLNIGDEELESLAQENEALNINIENLSAVIKKRDNALRLLLDEVKNLNIKIRDMRSELQAKNQ